MKRALLKHLDAPMRFLTFTFGDLIACVVPIFLGALFDSLFVIPLTGLLGVAFLKRLSKRLPRFAIMRCLYWVLPTERFNRFLRLRLPFSNKRLWIK